VLCLCQTLPKIERTFVFHAPTYSFILFRINRAEWNSQCSDAPLEFAAVVGSLNLSMSSGMDAVPNLGQKEG